MRLFKKALSATLALALTATTLTVMPGAEAVDAAANYNYGDALSKSLLFYELQESGEIEDDIRTNWRADSAMTDGADNNVDLTGGWYDAGDNLKLNMPMAYTGAMLAWSYLEDTDVYKESGQDKYMLQQLKRVNEYFIKCHASQNEYYFQVGDGADHNFWGAAEVMQMERPSFKATVSQPGSCVTAEAAASLATASIVFEESDPEFAATCLQHAEELYDLAAAMNGDSYYNDIAGAYYKSYSGFADEMSWAGAWLYKKTGNTKYLQKAEEYTSGWEKQGQSNDWGYKWTQGWDNVSYGARILLAEITGDSQYIDSTEQFLDYWTTGTASGERITYTPKGLAWLDTWGSLRYACNTAFLAYVWAESGLCTTSKVDTYKDFAKSQGDYCLGSTGRSFVCGFGENYPVSPHHRTASGVSTNNCDAEPKVNRHTLVGALVGGPSSSDSYTDVRTDYTANEVADDYNAAFTGLMAKLYGDFGGTIDPNLNAVEEPGEELYILAGLNSKYSANDNTFVEIKATVYNTTAWPARVTDNLSYKYFVDISDAIANGKTPADFTISTNYNQSGAKVSGLYPWDEANGIYYANIDLSGVKIYPGGQSEYRSELQFRIGVKGAWDYTASPSFEGLTGTSNNGTVRAEGIALYEGGELVFGKEPAKGTTVVKYAPTVSLTSPENGAAFTDVSAENPITISADASVVDSEITKVEFYNGSSLIASDATAPYSVDFVPTVDGTYTVKAIAYAANGKSTTSTTATITAKKPVVVVSPSPSPVVSEDPVVSPSPVVSEDPVISPSPVVTTTPSTKPAESSVKVSVTGNGGADTNTIGGQWTVTNSKGSVNLGDMAIRYYFTADTSASDVVYVDNIGLSLTEAPWYAALTSSTSAKVVKMANPTATADSYIEITFDADYNLTATGNLQMGIRMAKENWSNYNQANDYSYTNGAVVLVNGEVVCGAIPQQ